MTGTGAGAGEVRASAPASTAAARAAPPAVFIAPPDPPGAMPRPRVALIALLALVALPSTAAAHGDRAVTSGEETLTVPAGGELRFPFEVHYHRLLLRATPLDGPPVTLALVADGGDAALTWRSGPVDAPARVNRLVACCDDRPWAPFDLVVLNPDAGAAARLRLHARAVHDDLLVGFSGAEGDAWQVLAPFTVPTALMAYHVRPRRALPAAAASRDARALLHRSLLASGAVVTGLVALALVGDARYGGGPVVGLVAAAGSVLPSFGNLVVLLAAIGTWVYGGVQWVRALAPARAAPPLALRAAALGLAQAAAVGLVPVALVGAYGESVTTLAWMAFAPAALVQAAAAVVVLPRVRARPT